MVAAVLNRRGVQTALVGLLYRGYAIAITWPFILHPGSSIFGRDNADARHAAGPESIGAATATADYRNVSIQVESPMRFVATG